MAKARKSQVTGAARASQNGTAPPARRPTVGVAAAPRAKALRAANQEERGRQVVRLLDLLRTLEGARRGLTVKELLGQPGISCSERTIYRDLDHLAQAGFQVLQEEGRFRVMGPSIRSEALRPSQLLSLLIAGDCMAPWRGLGVETDLRALIHSLQARLTPEGRRWVGECKNSVAVTYRSANLALNTKSVEAIENAIVIEQCLRIDYAAPGRPAQSRIIEPHLLWQHTEQAYLVAFCREARAWRTFALCRIQSAELLDNEFERRADFDACEYVHQGFGAFHGPAHRVVLRFLPPVAHLPQERRFHPTQQVTEQADGSVELTMTAGGLPEIAAWLAGFGGKVMVVEPPELRELVRKIHAEGLQTSALSCADKGRV